MDARDELERIRDRQEDDPAAARERCERLVATLPADANEDLRADVLSCLADLRSREDDHAAATAAYTEVLPLLDRTGRGADAALAATNLAYHAARLRSHDDALRWAEEALERRRALGCQPALLRAHVNLGYYRLERGEPDLAESSFRNALQQARTFGDPAEKAVCLVWLGRALLRQDRRDRALLAYAEALPLLATLGSPLLEEARAEMLAIRTAPGGAR
jgi:tetratricopeptide (TPR) repeat protein